MRFDDVEVADGIWDILDLDDVYGADGICDVPDHLQNDHT